MAIVIDGVTLPDIPVVEGYPYAVIVLMEANFDGEFVSIYGVTYCSDRMYYEHLLSGGDVVGSDEWLIRPRTSTAYQCAYDGENNCWGEATEVVDDDIMPLGEYSMQGYTTTYTLLWANHDILTASKNSDLNIVATDEIYFPSSVVAEPEYGKIRIQIVRDIANSIRSKTGNTAKLTPEQMASEIDGIATIDELCDDEAVEITSNATTIPRYIFYKNSTLKTINLPRCTCVKQNAFNEATTLTTVNAPNCTSIDMDAFKGCKNLNNINLPSLVTLGVNAFSACSNLKYVDLPLCTSLKNSVFQQCTSLVSVIAPSVSVIDQYAFYNCTNVKLIDLSSCVTLNNQALYYTKNLSALVLRSEEICILQSVNAFQISSIASGTGYIYVPSALIDSYKVATNWSTYANQFRAIEDYPDICGA